MKRIVFIVATLGAFAVPGTICLLGKPVKPRTPEDICTSRQVTVYDNCRKYGGSEDICWKSATRRYNQCMEELKKKKETERANVTNGSDARPTIKTASPTPIPKKRIDSARTDASKTSTQSTQAPTPISRASASPEATRKKKTNN